jgi:hypothetical protein
MKKYITEEKHYKFYLDDFIRPQFTPDDGHNRAFEPFVSSIFGSFDNFELFINREDIKHPKLEIIRSFYSKLKSNNYQPVYYENPSKELKEKSG